LLFLRYMPMVAMSEVKGVLPHANPHHPDHALNGHSDGHAHEQHHTEKVAELATKNGGH